MEWKQLRKPPFVLLVLWSFAFEVTVIAFALSRTYADWTLVYTLGLASATALAGTDLALWVQAYYSRLSQDRQFRQEYTTKHVEEIYAPLCDEVAGVVENLKIYLMPRLAEWPKKKGTHYAFFVADEIRTPLDQLELFLVEDYYEAHLAGTKTASKVVVQEFRQALGTLLTSDRYSALQTDVSSDWMFVFDPTLRLPQAYTRKQVRGTLGNVDGSLQPDEKLDALFETMKKAFEALPEIQRLRSVRDEALRMAVPLLAVLKDRVQRPYELRT